MATATSSSSALVFLIVSAVALGLWAITFKLSGKSWRYELYSIDFGIGLALTAVCASYILGTAGSELGLSDVLLLSSRTNQLYAAVAAGLFAFGAMMVLLATSLLGVSLAYPIATAAALLALSVADFNSSRAAFLGGAFIAALVAIVFAGRAAGAGEATLPATSLPTATRRSSKSSSRKASRDTGGSVATKGTILAIIGGLALGAFTPLFARSVNSAYGLGAYAGILVLSIAVLATLLVLSVILMNVSLHGPVISLREYFTGKPSGHIFGLLGGIFCSAGILSFLIASVAKEEFRPDNLWLALTALLPCLFIALVALIIFREQSGAPGSLVTSALIAILLVAAAAVLYGMALDKAPAAPSPNAALLICTQQLRG